MPPVLRSDFSGQIYHALNRGNGRNRIFCKDEDFEAFGRVIKLGLEKYPVNLIAYQWGQSRGGSNPLIRTLSSS